MARNSRKIKKFRLSKLVLAPFKLTHAVAAIIAKKTAAKIEKKYGKQLRKFKRRVKIGTAVALILSSTVAVSGHVIAKNIVDKVDKIDSITQTADIEPLTPVVVTEKVVTPSSNFTPYYMWEGVNDIQKLTTLRSQLGNRMDSVIITAGFINKYGKIELHNPHPSKNELAALRAAGIKTSLMVTNFEKEGSFEAFGQMLSTSQGASQLALGIVQKAKDSGYDSITLDAERIEDFDKINVGVNEFYRFTDALKGEADKAKLGTIISVYPKRHSRENNIFDYKRLAKKHIINIMLYNEHGTWSEEGPVASKEYKEYALRFVYNDVDPQDLHNVIVSDAYFGAAWNVKVKTERGLESFHGPIPIADALRLAKVDEVTPQWDNEKGETVIRFKNGGIAYVANADSAAVTREIIERLAKEYNKPILNTGLWIYNPVTGDKQFIKLKNAQLAGKSVKVEIKSEEKTQKTSTISQATQKSRDYWMALSYLNKEQEVLEKAGNSIKDTAEKGIDALGDVIEEKTPQPVKKVLDGITNYVHEKYKKHAKDKVEATKKSINK